MNKIIVKSSRPTPNKKFINKITAPVKVQLQMYYDKFPIGFIVRGAKKNLAQLKGIYINPYEDNVSHGIMPLTPASLYHIKRVFDNADFDLVCKQWLNKEEMFRAFLKQGTQRPLEHDRLYEHQNVGVAFNNASRLIESNGGGVRVLLADDPRLGKTAQAIKTFSESGDYPILVLCLKSLVSYWAEQYLEWGDSDNVFILQGAVSERFEQAIDAATYSNAVVITNWQFISNLDKHSLAKISQAFNTLIGDEAHVLKNTDSQLHKAVKTCKMKNMLLLTATPTEKGVQELFPYLKLLRPAEFGSYWRFVTQFCRLNRTRFGIDVGKARNKKLLEDLIKPIVLRRTAKETVTIPDKVYQDIRVESSKKFDDLYKTMAKEIIMEIGDQTLIMPNALSTFTRLRQLSSFPHMLGVEGIEAPKLEPLVDIIENTGNKKDKFVVYVSFRDSIWYLAQELKKRGITSVKFTGRPTQIETFEKGAGNMFTKVLLTTPEMGGVGLDLNYARTIIFYDLPWSSIVYRQAIERTTKIGNTEPRFIITLLASAVDEYIAALLKKKLANIQDSQVIENLIRVISSELKNSGHTT